MMLLGTTAAGMRSGRFGYLTVQKTNIAVWKQYTFNATGARVSAEACQPRQNELCAGWLPSRVFAEDWLQFVLRPLPKTRHAGRIGSFQKSVFRASSTGRNCFLLWRHNDARR
jgi:hypothetical protein